MIRRKLELWGGHECTVNRVGDVWRDQSVLAGHHERLDDLDRFASLGLSTLRYPALWERVAPNRPDEVDFSWETERLERIRALGMRPIVGLIHHGSGPVYTSLVEDGFAPGLAAHARETVRRFPWVQDWTPVNEPLTTARFSALYGFWYPHATSPATFWLALLNQIDATRFAMREIRKERPDARLIQTEDLGYTHAGPACRDQADYENLRRWLTWDLLAGRVTRAHPMFREIARFGLADRLLAIADAPCPADVIGVNHYLTSERFLDERVEDYPPHLRGGNDRYVYADVEAVRIGEPLGLQALLRQTWERYATALAVTECHNGCTREEQMRWFLECWRGAEALLAEGVDVRAVTAWALLGNYDWSSLLTRVEGRYETGVFDLRGGSPRETGMAGLLRTLASGGPVEAPALDPPGWWRREDRLWRRPAAGAEAAPSGRPILITGRTGTLGQAFARACRARGLPFVLSDRATLDIACPRSTQAALERVRPWAVINAAGYVRVDAAESEERLCREINALSAERLADASQRLGARYVAFSSDLVFDGRLGRAYVETDATRPLSAYGRSKVEAERLVLAAAPDSLVIRTAAFFGPDDVHNFAVAALQAARAGVGFRAAEDLFVTPTYVPDLVDATLDLLIDGDSGLWHLTNEGRRSWAAFAREIAQAADASEATIEGVASASFGWPAPRPADVSLASARGRHLPSLESAIARFAAAMRRAARDLAA